MSEWKAYRLDDICGFENGDRGINYPGRKALVPTGIPFINAGHLHDGTIDWASMDYISLERFNLLGRGKIRKNDLLFCLRGSLGKFGTVEKDIKGAIASSLVIVRPRRLVETGFLAAYFRSQLCQSMIREHANGAAQPNLSAKNLRQFEIPLPPLPEQKRIVDILNEAFAGIETAIANTEKNLANARELFSSYLSQAIRRELELSNQSDLDQFVKFIDYRGRTPKKVDSGLRLITAKNVRMGYLQREPEEFVKPESYDSWMTRGIPREGDVLFTTEAPLGYACQLDTDSNVVFAQRIITLQPDRSVINPAYLKYALMSAPMQTRIHEKATGATASGIKASLLRKIQIPIPELSEQAEVVKRLEGLEQQCRNLEKIQLEKLRSFNELKQSLLQKAFSGELTADRAEREVDSATG